MNIISTLMTKIGIIGIINGNTFFQKEKKLSRGKIVWTKYIAKDSSVTVWVAMTGLQLIIKAPGQQGLV